MPLDVSEIVAKVRRIQITASRQVDDLLAGAYKSVFRGRGMEFEEVRAYTPGDDVRTIDWNVTARTGEPYVKRFAEERELTILFLVDVSGSLTFGSRKSTKLELATEVLALLMLSAQKNQDRLGLLLFDDEVRAYFPPRKGRAASRRLIREMVAYDAEAHREEPKERSARSTNLSEALGYVNRVQRRRAVVFVLSDFLDAEDWTKALRITGRRHDVIAIDVRDPREASWPEVGFVRLEDPETGEQIELDTHADAVREQLAAQASARERTLAENLRRSKVDRLAVDTERPYSQSLHRFFRMRERRRSKP